MLAIQVVKEERPLRVAHAPIVLVYSRIDVAIGVENVFPAVVVVIEESRAPAKKGNRHSSYARQKAHIRKISITFILVKRIVVVGKRCDVQRQMPAVVIISDAQPHGGLFAPVILQCKARGVAGVLECTVALIE